ncbi:MAG TPA: methyltransferase [Actinomycetota bacterium]|nr:methyltransferase [Actinomycetota bacterium]
MATIQEQATKVMGPLAGVASGWALDLGLRLGVFEHLAGSERGAPPATVARALALDPQYTEVLLRAAYAAEILERERDAYRLGEHMETLLLDTDSPAFVGGTVKAIVGLREAYLRVRDAARTGDRYWWSDMSAEWIDAVGDTGQAYYRRFLDIVLPQLPEIGKKLEAGARYIDLASGLCRGPAKIVQAFPSTKVTAVDCDEYTLESAEREMKELDIGGNFTYVGSFLEDLDLDGGHDLAMINISLHEARDMEKAVANAHAALDDGGHFVVHEFPFPESDEGLRTVPGRIMSGIQFFEAHIGCQLLPASRFVELLDGAGFGDVGTIEVTPTHVVIHGRK